MVVMQRDPAAVLRRQGLQKLRGAGGIRSRFSHMHSPGPGIQQPDYDFRLTGQEVRSRDDNDFHVLLPETGDNSVSNLLSGKEHSAEDGSHAGSAGYG